LPFLGDDFLAEKIKNFFIPLDNVSSHNWANAKCCSPIQKKQNAEILGANCWIEEAIEK
jgi:hypothetical protein